MVVTTVKDHHKMEICSLIAELKHVLAHLETGTHEGAWTDLKDVSRIALNVSDRVKEGYLLAKTGYTK